MTRPRPPLRIGSLFSGYGGLDLAVEAAFGADTAWVSDIDPGANKILSHRFPDAPNVGDITTVKWAPDCPSCGHRTVVRRQLETHEPFYWCERCETQHDVSLRLYVGDGALIPEPVDIICGGSPCQDLSHAGRRAGMTTGTRSNTWVNMREAIATIRPTYVVWENVRGAFSAGADSAVEPCPGCVGDASGVNLRALGRVLGDLSDLGYDTEWRGLRAADVGAPHGRFRVFVIARLADAPRVGRDEGRPEPARLLGRPDAPLSGHADAPLTLLPSPRGSDTNGAGRHGDGGLDLRTAVTLLPTPAVNDMGKAYTPEEWDAWTARMQAKHGNGNGHGKSLEIEAQRLLPTPRATRGGSGTETMYELGGQRTDDSRPQGEIVLMPTTTAADAGASGADPETSNVTLTDALVRGRTDFGDYAPAIHRWEHVIGRPAPDPTEPTGRGGAHRLSPRFTEWMMGVPDGWITDTPDLTRNEALKACGNGVVPQQAYAAITDALHHHAQEGISA